jgi:hypothetical protein
LVALCTLLVLSLVVLSAEYKGKVKSVDADKNTVTVTIDDKDKTFTVPDEAKIYVGDKESKKRLKSKGFADNPKITVVTEGEGDKEVVKELKVERKKKE